MFPRELSLSRFLRPYYLLHYSIILSFFLLRYFYLPPASESQQFAPNFLNLNNNEQQIYLVFALLFFSKFRKSPTLEAVNSHFLFFLKCSALAVCLALSQFFVFAIYFIIFVILFFFSFEPRYNGPNNVLRLTELQFRSSVLNHSGSASGSASASGPGSVSTLPLHNVYYLVLFTHRLHPDSLHFESTFAALSLRYQSIYKNLHFLLMDLKQFPGLYSLPGLGITTPPDRFTPQQQIPRVALFQNGHLVCVIPSSQWAESGVYYGLTEALVEKSLALNAKGTPNGSLYEFVDQNNRSRNAAPQREEMTENTEKVSSKGKKIK